MKAPEAQSLGYVEDAFEARTKLAAFLNILLKVDSKLSICPILIGAGTHVFCDIPAGEEVSIGRLEGHLAIHEHVRPYDIQLVADVPLGVVRLRKDIDALCGAIPIILRIGQVQTGGLNFNMVILGRTGRTLVRRWGNGGVGVSLHGREQPHAAADHGSLVHPNTRCSSTRKRCCVTG